MYDVSAAVKRTIHLPGHAGYESGRTTTGWNYKNCTNGSPLRPACPSHAVFDEIGITLSTLGLLARAKAGGADFGTSLTIGRQKLFLQTDRVHKDRSKLAAAFGPAWPACERALQDESLMFEPLFRALGATVTDSLDFSPFEGASVIHDMNAPIPPHLKE